MSYSLLQLNTWMGKAVGFFDLFEQLMSDNNPDFVCLQEVHEDFGLGREFSIHKDLEMRMLVEFKRRYWSKYEFTYSPRISTWISGGNYSLRDEVNHWGNVIMWKRDEWTLMESRTRFLWGGHDTYNHHDDTTLPVNIQSVVLQNRESGKNILMCNVHGWYAGKGVGKVDTPQRFEQSEKIVQFIKEFGDIPVLLSGDFNLDISNESLQLLEEGLGRNSNAIKNFNIELTRTTLYPEAKRIKDPHANYILSNEHIFQIGCKAYTEMQISDHAPLVLDFDITG